MHFRWLLLCLIFALSPLMAHCGKAPSDDGAKLPADFKLAQPMDDFCQSDDEMDQEQCAWWRQKAAEDLLGPDAANLELHSDTFEDPSRETFLNQLMETEAFALQMLDFNLYHLGFKDDPQFGSGRAGLSPQAANFPHAISSAKAILENGNYLSLFDMKHPAYLTAVGGDPFLTDEELAELENPDSASAKEKRDYLTNKFLKSLLTVKTHVIENANEDKGTICEGINGGLDQDALFRIGYPFQIVIPILFGEEWLAPVFFYCAFDMEQPPLVEILDRSYSNAKIVFESLDKLATEQFQATTLSELQEVDAQALNLGAAGSPLSFLGFWIPLQNSSTNYNRRRASYVLKRYFCDDLTPVDVELPAEHGKGRHGDDPSCMSCHYKLDPMAGFFRYRGVSGIDFQNFAGIFFDDGARKDLEEYTNHWEDPEEGFGIGYIRSATDESLNDYGDSLEDLFGIIRKAPEARTCVVERLFDYFVDESQTIDRGFLLSTAEPLLQSEEESSAQAIKTIVKSILLSRTYSQRDRDPDQCYDYAAGTTPSHRPPCQVASVLEANCKSCHSASNASGGLDLTTWHEQEEGFGFQHLDSGGTRLTPSESKQLILDRITTADEDLRMPLQMHMSSKDREIIFLWLNDELSQQEGDR